MVINSRFVTIYGFVSIAVLLLLLVLVWLHLADSSLHTPILLFAALLVVSRILLRIIVNRRTRREGTTRLPTGAGPAGS